MDNKRLYEAYAKTHFDHSPLMREASYDAIVPFYRANYLPHLPRDRTAPIVDLGCGAGQFLYFLRKEGYTNACGVDWSPEMVAHCRSQGLTNVEEGDLFEFLAKHRKGFRAIVCNDLIEHIARARMLDFLGLVRGALDDGPFLVKTMNAGSLFGAREVFIDFTHEVGFTAESLAQALRLGGFDSVTILPLRTAPTRWQGHLVRFAGKHVIETMLRLIILIMEGPGARTPMVLTPQLLAVARSSTRLSSDTA